MVDSNAAWSVSTADFDALIFDLDGVITDTASVHAAAWKQMLDDFLTLHASRNDLPFQPFEIKTDYLSHVDGKPRRDGLRSFLESRGISLPEGGPDDPPGAETIHGLGRRKNEFFLQRIREKGVKAYEHSVALVHSARKHGLKTAIISSSRSCAMILDAAGLSELFDVRVDGVASEKLGIPGKPAPDIFLEAANQLRVRPERAVVIEDAVSGVQAGRAGAFGRVIGIARHGSREALETNGADIVVADLSGIRITSVTEKGEPLPSALDNLDRISDRADGKQIAVFLDYDGTLCPIVETPELAVIPEEIRDAVIALARHCPLGIISGRDLEDVRDKLQIDGIVYAGSHGFDITGPNGLQIDDTLGEKFLPALEEAEELLACRLGSVSGVLVERKKFAVAIHYRRVDPGDVEGVEAAVDEVAARHPELRKAFGKKIFELQPKTDWHKGKALLSLLGAMGLDRNDVLPFYIGDDVTDEDAFRSLKGRGIGVVVRNDPYETAADYSLRDPDEVRRLLLQLVPLCRRS